MTEWIGFTDDDLKRLKSGSTKDSTTENVRAPNRGARTASRGKPPPRRPQKNLNLHSNPAAAASNLTTDQMLAPPKTTSVKSQPAKSTSSEMGKEAADRNNNPGASWVAEVQKKSRAKDTEGQMKDEAASENPGTVSEKGQGDVNLKELDETEGISREMSHMQDFQQQQKMMEELNKKKRDLLAKAIQQRQKAAKAESKKLLHIQAELGKLDQMLNADVAIIRDKIEEVSRDFLEAQRHYEKMERQFIEAKMDLHKKEEQKEHLTEHLYTIIHQNEVRKARKLEDLMHKLELESAEDSFPEVAPVQLPQLAVINPMQLAKTPHSPAGDTVPTSPQEPPGEQQQQEPPGEQVVQLGPSGEPGATVEVNTTAAQLPTDADTENKPNTQEQTMAESSNSGTSVAPKSESSEGAPPIPLEHQTNLGEAPDKSNNVSESVETTTPS